MQSFMVPLVLEGKGPVQFSCTKIYTSSGEKLFVTVADETGLHSFDLRRDSGVRWKIVQSAPAWILAAETTITEAIMRKMEGMED